MVEEAEMARHHGRLDEAEAMYATLSRSPTLAQEMLGLLGLGEVQRRRRNTPTMAERALRRSKLFGFGYGQVHAAVTLGLAGQISTEEAEAHISGSLYVPPIRGDVGGLLRFCQGADPERHLLCFP